MGIFDAIGSVIGKVVGGVTGVNAQAKAAGKAADIQGAAAQAGIDEQRRQFDEIIKLMAPFVTGGQQAFGNQGNLVGLGGPQAEQDAIAGIQDGPLFSALNQQGQDAILQNASATGGLRGGNVQGALAEFSPNLLNSLIQQRFQNLGSLSSMGQASASGQAAFGQQTGANVANLLQQQGAASAGGVLAKGGAQRQAFGDLVKVGSAIAGAF
jgi:hypothetical protein